VVKNRFLNASAGPIRIAIYAGSIAIFLYLGLTAKSNPYLADFITVFTSILLEAFPFILLGTLISSILHLYVQPSTIARALPKGKLKGLLVAAIAGFAFPICECANVPVTRRLIEKQLPVHIAITFLLSVAIVNPVVLLSTWIAFGGNLTIVLLRAGLGMTIAILIGWIISLDPTMQKPLRLPNRNQDDSCGCESDGACDHDHEPGAVQDHSHQHDCNCDCDHDHDDTSHAAPQTHGKPGRLHRIIKSASAVLGHTGTELYMVGRFMIMGAAIAALMQTVLPRAPLISIGTHPIISVLALMILAYLLSLCSEADAFIGATFAAFFSPGAIMAFLVFGPMVDVKNTLMMLDAFKPAFTWRIIVLVSLMVLVAGLGINVAVRLGVVL